MNDAIDNASRAGAAPTPAYPAAPPAPAANPFPPLIVLGCAVLLWVGFQTYALISERDVMQTTATQLATQVEAAKKVRASVDSIATGVKRLADSGNANARVIVDELARRGVTINPNPGQAVVPAK